MPRYRSKAARSLDRIEVPEGWTIHDGQGMPVDPQDRPAVLFRSGLKMQPKFAAAYWMSMASGDAWVWTEDAQATTDIIAWQIER